MKKRWSMGLGALALLATVPLIGNTPVLANLQEAGEAIVQAIKRPDVRLELSAAKRIIIKGKDGKDEVIWNSLGDKGVVQSGDILRYTLQSKNKGEVSAKNLTITQPVPQGMVYELESAKSRNNAAITYSIDGGKTYTAKPTIKITLQDGTVEEKDAPADAYTHIRYKFNREIAPEAGLKATYLLKVR